MHDGGAAEAGPLLTRLVERTGRTQGLSSAGARVLIVHTDSGFRGYLTEVLEGEGYQVAEADHLMLACQLLHLARYDAVVTDLLGSTPPSYRSVQQLVAAASPTPVALCLRQRERLRVHPAHLGLAASWSTESGARSLVNAVSFLVRASAVGSMDAEEPREPATIETQQLREIRRWGLRPRDRRSA